MRVTVLFVCVCVCSRLKVQSVCVFVQFLPVALTLKHQLDECSMIEEGVSNLLGGIQIRRPRNSE